MAVRLPKKAQRRLSHFAIILFVYLSVWYILLPLDSPLRLAIYFNASRLRSYLTHRLSPSSARDAYLTTTNPSYPLDLSSDIAYLVKTGYGTRHRLPEQLDAFRQTGDLLGQEGRDFLVVGDWTAANATDQAAELGATVHDALSMVLQSKLGQDYEHSPRFVKYQDLQRAIELGDETKATELGKSFGWELDALKFVLGMDLLYDEMPSKKWYIILDDDTYLVRPSLYQLLSHLNPREPFYIGNAVGDYRGRFAHGGSAVVLSAEAMRRLFAHPDVVLRAYMDSLEETWGDKLVATTLQKVGVYLDERYNHHFNGEFPDITRIGADRFCSPIVSFHGLRQPGDMSRVGRVLGHAQEPVLWGQLWDLFAAQPIQDFVRQSVQTDKDHVGVTKGRGRTWAGVATPEGCKARCEGDRDGCLAWTFATRERTCTTSPWLIIGTEVGAQGKRSGVNWPLVDALRHQCR
ncbi:fringe-like domain-containing protein [Sarocladium implicatum]|nr:fringe-like domain-containing protein [Sarocladium implicatum]